MPGNDTNVNPQPLTPEQLQAVHAVADDTARRQVRSYRRNAVVGFVVLVLGIVGGNLLGNQASDAERDAIVGSGQVVAIDGCNRDFKVIDNLRNEVKRSIGRTQRLVDEGVLTQAQGNRSVRQSRGFLRRYTLPDCRQAGRVLTADPDHDLEVTKPRFPGDGR